MANTYELIKTLENQTFFVNLLNKNVIPLTILDKKVQYERFLIELENESRWQAIINTSEEYNVSESTIRRAIIFMES